MTKIRTALSAVFSEKDLEDFIADADKAFSSLFDKKDADAFNAARKIVVENSNAPTDEFDVYALKLANALCYRAAMEDIYDRMLESNISVFHSKESISEARHKVEEIRPLPLKMHQRVDARSSTILELLSEGRSLRPLFEDESQDPLEKAYWERLNGHLARIENEVALESARLRI